MSIQTTINTAVAELEVNKFARRARHLRIFSRSDLIKIHLIDLVKAVFSPVGRLVNTTPALSLRRFLANAATKTGELVPVAPQKKLIFEATILSIVSILVSSLTPGATLSAAYTAYSNEYIESYALPGDVLVADENGYLVKINPQTNQGTRIGLTDYAVHTIENGESLSVIAQRYGISVETIIWENGLGNANSIRAGQKLLIPPVSGISYKVKSGDTLKKLADTYKVSTEAIIAQNGLDSEALVKGQNLFLPGAKPIAPINTVAANYRATGTTRNARLNLSNSDATPAIGKIFIFPTTGKITQGFHAGHYALDIADRSKPAVWAGAAGTVEKASSGTWGGGYGNHVVIDHGDGVKTLYAHMASLNVKEGDYVNQGDVLGQMGNTGRVYGATGIHLHWEITINGVKKNPIGYY